MFVNLSNMHSKKSDKLLCKHAAAAFSLFFFRWEGEGVDEIGRDKDTKTIRVKVNAKYYRPTEVELLIGDASKAKAILGWEAKVTLQVISLHKSVDDNCF